MTPRLITTPMSHFCEKARWALDHARLEYAEERHAPLFSRLRTWRAHGTVPVLLCDDGVLGDSTDILRWVDRRAPLYRGDAAELEERFDELLGPAARVLALFHVERDRPLATRVALAGVPGWERTLGSAVFGLAAAYVRRRYGVSPEGTVRARAGVDAAFVEVAARLADGRRFLCGDELGAADITFAALAAPVVLPDSDRTGLPRREEVSQALRQMVDELRATPAGAFVMRLYAESRA